MEKILQLSLIAVLPVVLSVIFYLLESTKRFKRMPYMARQAIIGISFGALAICGTEFGVNVGGATMNARDSAPICAGLLFGMPAGVISGVIGGIERWFATFWGAGNYTRLACSISTVFAGVFSAVLRKYMFDDKKASWYYCLGVSVITEIVHMLMIFLTNMSDVRTAFTFVRACSLPMITVNAIAVTLASIIISILSKKFKKLTKKGLKNLSQTFQRWLLACVVLGFLLTTLFTWSLQTKLSINNAKELVRLNVSDVKQDVFDASNENLLDLTKNIKNELDLLETIENSTLDNLKNSYDVSEINVVNSEGKITVTTFIEFLGYDMKNGTQSAEFLALLSGEKTELVQAYLPTSYDKNIMRKYAGVTLAKGGFVQVGYDAERFQRDIDDKVRGVTRNRHVGSGGSIIIADEELNVVSDGRSSEGKKLNVTGLNITNKTEGKLFEQKVYGEDCYCVYILSEGYFIIGVIPKQEALFSREISVYVTVFMEFVVFGILFILVYFLIKKLIVENISKINDSLSEITAGNLNVIVNVRANQEFASLSDDINTTVDTLKGYISEAKSRIDKELEFAKAIQHSALPSVFPPYPDKKEFDIFADMVTAKEVGGDFYDFYFVGENRLAFLIADVSGKGIPAALFMMSAKTIIKGYAETGISAEETLTIANKKLCEGNDAGMFVTCWLGILDLKTREIEYVNAGHTPPIIKRKDGKTEILKGRSGFVLAGLDGVKYKQSKIILNKGDKIFLYTDGVTEAIDKNQKLYGENRLLETLSSLNDLSAEYVCRSVKKSVDEFVGEAEQFDDITMLCLKINDESVKEITVEAQEKNVEIVTKFVNEQLEKTDCSKSTLNQIDVAIDELFGNIARYAYENGGPATVAVEVIEEPLSVEITFIDNGVPYDPLKNTDPDVSLSAEERNIGGLGIFLVKKTMDDISYEYKNGKNILKIKKHLK